MLASLASLTVGAVAVKAEVLTNADVPAAMNAGSSSYTIDDFTRTWGTTAVVVGNTTSGNQLTVINGGSASTTTTSSPGVSIGKDFAATNNGLTVTGAGSTFTSNTAVYIGERGTGNSLAVRSGATFTASSLSLGYGRSDSDAYASNNTALFDGAGTQLTLTGTVTSGNLGSSNSLTVTNGAVVQSNSGSLGIGASGVASFGSNNSITVDGVGTQWNTNGTTGRMTVGGSGSGNTFTLSGGATSANKQFYIGSGHSLFSVNGQNNTARLTGAGTKMTSSIEVRVGDLGGGNQLVIENGAQLDSSAASLGTVGVGLDSAIGWGNNNTATIRGSGSAWNQGGQLIVGDHGSGNTLQVLNGGRLDTVNVAIGNHAAVVSGVTNGSNNQLLVDGAGSRWISTGNVAIGIDGNGGNRLTVSHGALAEIGDDAGDTFTIAAGNVLQLDGGYLALFGDQRSTVADLISGQRIEVADAVGGWSFATAGQLQVNYVLPGADTTAFTGGLYSNLDGFTIVSAVPEPGSAVAIFAIGAIGLLRRRR